MQIKDQSNSVGQSFFWSGIDPAFCGSVMRQVRSIMLVLFDEDRKSCQKLIENGLTLLKYLRLNHLGSKYLEYRYLVGCLEKDVLAVEKSLSKIKKIHQKIPLIQVCPVLDNFIRGVVQQAEEYGVDLFLFQSDSSRLHPLSRKKIEFLELSSIPSVMTLRNKKLNFHLLETLLFFEWEEQLDPASVQVLERAMSLSNHPVLLIHTKSEQPAEMFDLEYLRGA